MNLDSLRHFLNAEPFEPFEVRLSNGDIHQVRHRDNMAVGKNTLAILYDDSSRMATCTPHHVVSVEKLIESLQSEPNGTGDLSDRG